MKTKMLISKEKGLYKDIDAVKTSTGRFFTVKSTWLTKPVKNFIKRALNECDVIVDPFAGDGHLLTVCKKEFKCKTAGLDINNSQWPKNDSLLMIPKGAGQIIVTNPPYLAKYSAKRKGVAENVAKYFELMNYEDIYQIALANCIDAARFVVAIIPETFIGSIFPKRNLVAVSVLEANPFTDTDVPVCVACFDSHNDQGDVYSEIYKADVFCGTFGQINKYKQTTVRSSNIKFNCPDGQIAFRAVDGTDPLVRIKFLRAADFHYQREKIKISSRLLTYIKLKDLDETHLDALVEMANEQIERIRAATNDIILSPFKGNNKSGVRRRRLDYELARSILSNELVKLEKNGNDLPLFEFHA